MMKRLLKSFEYRVINPYIDNKYWKVAEQHQSKVKCLFKEVYNDKLKEYSAGSLDLNKLKKKDVVLFNFFSHYFSAYIYRLDHVILEPDYGWVILSNNKIFNNSFPLINDPWDKIKPRPKTYNFFANRLSGGKTIKIEKAISIRYAWQNYYHFFIDALPQLGLINFHKIPLDIPIIVPHFFSSIKFVKEFRMLSDYINRPLIIQKKDTYYEVEELYVAKNVFFSNHINDIINSLTPFHNLNELSENKIFVTRVKEDSRSLINSEEIENMMAKKGFEIINAGDFSLRKQIELFGHASVVVGIHGAALTNTIFRKGKPLKIFEIFPGSGFHPGHYKNISKVFNFQYDSIEGDYRQNEGNFYLDPERLKKKLSEFINI